MRIAGDIGHNVSYDGGAVGFLSEDICNRETARIVFNELRKAGHEVIDVTPSNATSLEDSLNQRWQKANDLNCDYFFSIHHNAGGGTGSEVYCYLSDPKGVSLANSILNEISSLGFKNRGIKDGMALAVICNTKMTALLVECIFVDCKDDFFRYNPVSMGRSIAKGIINVIGGNQVEQVQNEIDDKIYIVAVGDTLWSIARKFNTTVDELVKRNNIQDKNFIEIGQKINIS